MKFCPGCSSSWGRWVEPEAKLQGGHERNPWWQWGESDCSFNWCFLWCTRFIMNVGGDRLKNGQTKKNHTLNNWWVKSPKHWSTSARNHSCWNIHWHVQPSSLSTSSVAEVLVHWWYSTGHPASKRSFCTSACSLFFYTYQLSVSYRTYVSNLFTVI